MKLEPGVRVRCVDGAMTGGFLTKGEQYFVLREYDGYVEVRNETGFVTCWWMPERFKPIIRVKAPCVPTLDLLLKRSVAAVKRMSPEEKAAMWRTQRESWARSCTGSGAD